MTKQKNKWIITWGSFRPRNHSSVPKRGYTGSKHTQASRSGIVSRRINSSAQRCALMNLSLENLDTPSRISLILSWLKESHNFCIMTMKPIFLTGIWFWIALPLNIKNYLSSQLNYSWNLDMPKKLRFNPL